MSRFLSLTAYCESKYVHSRRFSLKDCWSINWYEDVTPHFVFCTRYIEEGDSVYALHRGGGFCVHDTFQTRLKHLDYTKEIGHADYLVTKTNSDSNVKQTKSTTGREYLLICVLRLWLTLVNYIHTLCTSESDYGLLDENNAFFVATS